ncbi:hypothetical protein QJS04_geneDACA006444 [Acorus gramineus]|uniref:Uncharacterized protein n=1 Tax=Acorus gramineus TaxID=55184 RepID=A0AAV9AV41_ACOGR|nr:hypothetical protein QJS04_geneDACA006444 [Acorus gramineus]
MESSWSSPSGLCTSSSVCSSMASQLLWKPPSQQPSQCTLGECQRCCVCGGACP